MKQSVLAVILACPVWALAATPPPPDPGPAPEPKPELELRLNTAQPEAAPERPQVEAAEKAGQRVLEVNESMLLANPELLSRAMQSAVAEQNIAGIKVLLPIYEKWPQHDAMLAKYARAVVLQADGRSGQAVNLYREMIAEQPDAPAVRLRLAQALFDDQQNEAAADQFDRLSSEPLPDAVRQTVERYRTALRERDSLQIYGGISVSRETNINQAPKQRTLGSYLAQEQCELARAQNAEDDCWRGWRFNEPVDALGVSYQLGAEKKWSLSDGFYIKASADGYGKYYPSEGEYNDSTVRVSAGVGHAGQRHDIGLMPFHERRIYGNDAYSYTNGARLYWNRWQTRKLQSLTALEYGRLNNMQRPNADADSLLASGSLVFYRNARQYWLGGADYYQERNKDDRSDNFNRYAVRAAWGQEWPLGLSTRLTTAYAERRYEMPSFFSDGEKRHDKELSSALSLWHRALHFGGITPRLTVSRHRTISNDVFYEYSKTRAFIELNKTF